MQNFKKKIYSFKMILEIRINTENNCQHNYKQITIGVFLKAQNLSKVKFYLKDNKIVQMIIIKLKAKIDWLFKIKNLNSLKNKSKN